MQHRNSVCHSAIIFANALMHKGTTVDAFLRQVLLTQITTVSQAVKNITAPSAHGPAKK